MCPNVMLYVTQIYLPKFDLNKNRSLIIYKKKHIHIENHSDYQCYSSFLRFTYHILTYICQSCPSTIGNIVIAEININSLGSQRELKRKIISLVFKIWKLSE